MVDGGGQLARAAAYIRERSIRRSPAFDEFVRRTPKVPPDRMTESKSRRHILIVVSEKEKMSANSGSPESMMESASFSHSQSNAALSQPNGEAETVPPAQPEAPRANELSTGLSESVPLDPRHIEAIRSSLEHLGVADELVPPVLQVEAERPLGFTKRRPELLVVSKIETSAYLHSPITSAALTPLTPLPAFLSQAMSINQPSLGLDWLLLNPPPSVVRHSPKHQVARRPPIPKPGRPWAYPRRSQNVECGWRARCKPPSVVVTTKRRSDCVVSIIINLSASEHLPSSEAAFVLPISPPACLLWMCNPHRLSPELVTRVLKPPNRVAYNRLLHEVINTLNKREYSVTHLGWNTTTHRSLCSSSPRPLLRIAGCGCRVSRCPRLLVAVFGQHN